MLKIATLGDKILLKKAKSVTNIKDSDVQKLIDEMIATLKNSKGVGIAAPQVFESKRIIIVNSYPNSRYPYAPEFGPEAMINPRIIKKSKKKEKGWEGCLSVPGYRGLVPRHERITVKYTSRDGKTKTMGAEGFIARIIQHEVDHLEGRICFLYWLDDVKNLMTEENWRKMLAEKK